MHRRLPCELTSRHPLLQFGIQHTGVAPSASGLLKLSAPWSGEPVPVCHGARHRNDFNICHRRFQLLPGRGSSSGHKGCLCRAWCDGRAKLLHVMCLGNWEMAEISGAGTSCSPLEPSPSQVPCFSLASQYYHSQLTPPSVWG